MRRNEFTSVLLVDMNNIARGLFEVKAAKTVAETMHVINRAREAVNATQVVACFDGKDAKEPRKRILPEYNLKRAKSRELPVEREKSAEFRKKLVELYKIIQKRWYTESHTGFEADDAIGALVHCNAASEERRICILSNDRDLFQCMRQDRVSQMTYKKGNLVLMTERFLIEREGVRPDQWLDYKILVGDSSDGVTGVQKVGHKTAIRWLSRFQNVEKMVQNISQLTGGELVKKNLQQDDTSGRLELLRRVLSLWVHCPVAWRWDSPPPVVQKQVAEMPMVEALLANFKGSADAVVDLEDLFKDLGDGPGSVKKVLGIEDLLG